MRTPYSQKAKVRSVPLSDAEVVSYEYNRVGLALAIFAALCFFSALWGLNGYFTARTVYSIGVAFNRDMLSWGAGWLVHVTVSLIEHHLWRLREAIQNAPRSVLFGVYCLILVVGVLDVFTSTIAFLVLFQSFGLPVLDPSVRLTSTIVAEIIAILPEPVIVWLIVALYRVLKNGEVSHA